MNFFKKVFFSKIYTIDIKRRINNVFIINLRAKLLIFMKLLVKNIANAINTYIKIIFKLYGTGKYFLPKKYDSNNITR